MASDLVERAISGSVRERRRLDLIRRGLLPGERGSDREERLDLSREISAETGPLSTTDQGLMRWLFLPRWKRWLWTVIR